VPGKLPGHFLQAASLLFRDLQVAWFSVADSPKKTKDSKARKINGCETFLGERKGKKEERKKKEKKGERKRKTVFPHRPGVRVAQRGHADGGLLTKMKKTKMRYVAGEIPGTFGSAFCNSPSWRGQRSKTAASRPGKKTSVFLSSLGPKIGTHEGSGQKPPYSTRRGLWGVVDGVAHHAQRP